jgi:hypothetical protein
VKGNIVTTKKIVLSFGKRNVESAFEDALPEPSRKRATIRISAESTSIRNL